MTELIMERAAFEAWVLRGVDDGEPDFLERNTTGEYIFSSTVDAWCAWQAGAISRCESGDRRAILEEAAGMAEFYAIELERLRLDAICCSDTMSSVVLSNQKNTALSLADEMRDLIDHPKPHLTGAPTPAAIEMPLHRRADMAWKLSLR